MVGGISGAGAGRAAGSGGAELPKPPKLPPPAQPANASAEITAAAGGENWPKRPPKHHAMTRAPLEHTCSRRTISQVRRQLYVNNPNKGPASLRSEERRVG